MVSVVLDWTLASKDFEKLKKYLEVKKAVEVICAGYYAAPSALDNSEEFQQLLNEKYSLKTELLKMFSVKLEMLNADDLIKM